MKVISSFVLLLTAVTVFASDSPPVETHQVLYLADAGVVVLRLSGVVEGEGPKQWGNFQSGALNRKWSAPACPFFNCVYGQARRLPYVFQQAANITTALGDGRVTAYADFRQAVCWKGRSQ